MSSTNTINSLRSSLIAGLVLATLSVSLPLRGQDVNSDAAVAPVTFSQQTTPNPRLNDFLFGISGDSLNDIWAVGTTVPGAIALHFNGSTWKSVPMAMSATANMRALSVLAPNDVWAVGEISDNTGHVSSVIQHFNGTKWSVVQSLHFATGEQLFAMKAIASNDVFAVGELNSDQHAPQPLVEHFDGATWSLIPTPALAAGQTLSLAAIAATGHSDVWVTGAGGPVFFPAILHFNGQKFTNVAFPLKSNVTFGGVSAIAPNDAWLVGAKSSGASVSAATLTAHWDGTRWTVVPSPNATSSNVLGAVSAISSTDVWAVGCGICGQDTGAGSIIVEHWDGTKWTLNPVPALGNGDLASDVLALPSGDVFVAGVVSGQGAFAHNLVLHGKEGN